MNKKEFSKIVAKKFDLSQEYSLDLVRAVFATLSEVLNEGHNVYIYGFGTFKHKVRKAKRLRHPKTGEMIEMPEKKIIAFSETPSVFSDEE